MGFEPMICGVKTRYVNRYTNTPKRNRKESNLQTLAGHGLAGRCITVLPRFRERRNQRCSEHIGFYGFSTLPALKTLKDLHLHSLGSEPSVLLLHQASRGAGQFPDLLAIWWNQTVPDPKATSGI